MKLVTAIIQPIKMNDVKKALTNIGIQGLTLTEVKGYGRQKGHTELYRGSEYKIDFITKIQLEVVASDTNVDLIIETIMKAAASGNVGDGKIFVKALDTMIRIRTNETGEEAIK